MKRIAISLGLLLTCAGLPANAAVDSCLVGYWKADLSDVADMMALQMGGNVSAAGGEVVMDISEDGSFLLTAIEPTFSLQMPDMPIMDVKVSGFSAGDFDATDGVFLTTVLDYSLVGSADVLGSPLVIPFDSATGLGGGGAGSYNCSGDSLRFEASIGGPAGSNRMPRIWTRTPVR